MRAPRHQMVNGRCRVCRVTEKHWLDVPCITPTERERSALDDEDDHIQNLMDRDRE